MELNRLTIKQASDKLAKGEISSVELTKACLERIKQVDNKIKACLTVCEKEAMKMASDADERSKKGEKGDLLGIPCLIKDNILTKGINTTAASRILENYIAPYDATVIKKIKAAGAVILGKTNLDEFAHGASTENSAFFPTHNPWNLDCVPGGSSGGSAAAVVADMCIFALGTDTGGSIRQPASFCGVVGLKPSYGRSSRFGLIAMTSSTDVPGTLTKTAGDAAIVLKVIAGHDKKDATTAPTPTPNPSPAASLPATLLGAGAGEGGLDGLRVGVPKEYFIDGMDKGVEQAVREAIKKLAKLRAEVIEVSLPYTKYAVPVYYIITPSEISSNLARFDGIKYGLAPPPASLRSAPSPAHTSRERGGSAAKTLMEVYTKTRGKGFGPEAKRRIMIGTYALSAGYFDAYYLQAQKVRTKIIEDFDRVFSQVDVLATPTSPNVAFKIGAKSNDPLEMYLEDIFVSGASLAGLPAISVPCGMVSNLPVGLQLIGKRFAEATIFQIARSYEQATEWHQQKPKL